MLVAYNPSQVAPLLTNSNLERIYMGRAPELSVVAQAYGTEVPISWLEIQLSHLSEYAGAGNHMPPAIIRELAQVILANFYYLKLSELMLFFSRVMAGHYGVFYGSVDPIHLTVFMRQFLLQRNDDIDRIERRRRQQPPPNLPP